jgi:hypothetical protein
MKFSDLWLILGGGDRLILVKRSAFQRSFTILKRKRPLRLRKYGFENGLYLAPAFLGAEALYDPEY